MPSPFLYIYIRYMISKHILQINESFFLHTVKCKNSSVSNNSV